MAESPRKPLDARRRKRRSELWIVAGVLAVLAGALAYAARDVLTGDAVEPATDEVAEPGAKTAALAKPPLGRELGAERQAKPAPGLGQSANADSELIDDDGETLWASPTHGPPLDLAYLPPGVEIILAMRPEAIADHPDGKKSFDAVQPVFGNGTKFVADALPGVHGVRHLIVGFSIDRSNRWQTSIVAEVTGHSSASNYLASSLPEAIEKNYRGSNYWLANGRAYFLPGIRDTTIVVVPADLIADVIELTGNPPALRAEYERLLAHTDSDRQITLVAPPNLAFRQGEKLFVGEMFPLWHALEWLFGNDVSVAALSLHWDDNFFTELVAVPTLDSSPEEMSRELAARVNELPDRVEEYVLGIDASPYGRRVVARLPEMVRKLAAYTRHGFDRDAAVLRCYLPVAAGHNLIMGAELALAEGVGAGRSTAPLVVRPLAEASSPLSISERLRKNTSLRFGREELEAALNMLAQDIGVEIVIRGPDLQLDGITRNQLFGIDMADQPAEAILVEILRRANPDKLAAGPADPRQKLIYVVGPKAIFVTTRTKAAERGEPLPAAFQPAP